LKPEIKARSDFLFTTNNLQAIVYVKSALKDDFGEIGCGQDSMQLTKPKLPLIYK
jgi:hypothetical protein